MLLDKQGAAEDSHDFVDVSFKFHFMFDYCDNAVSAYSRINLYSDGCLGITPECGDSKVLFDPFEERKAPPAIGSCKGTQSVWQTGRNYLCKKQNFSSGQGYTLQYV